MAEIDDTLEKLEELRTVLEEKQAHIEHLKEKKEQLQKELAEKRPLLTEEYLKADKPTAEMLDYSNLDEEDEQQLKQFFEEKALPYPTQLVEKEKEIYERIKELGNLRISIGEILNKLMVKIADSEEVEAEVFEQIVDNKEEILDFRDESTWKDTVSFADIRAWSDRLEKMQEDE